MKITRHGFHEDIRTYTRSFDYVGYEGCGYSFDCTASGVLLSKTPLVARTNYLACLTGQINGRKLIDFGIVMREATHYHPPQGLCECGVTLDLAHFTNTCDCNREYNSAGQLLAPREFWGEETGETYADLQGL